MNNRQSFIFKEEDSNVILKVITLCPSKWLLIDRETGQAYQGNSKGYWDRLDPVIKIDKDRL
jgi:hypothetical protein